ncbi:MAG: UDP-N-acetylmuramate--L-alanine ligase [Candidatus Terrybacteria bacterium CG10_big_fil_rev_8_21_14_0_10_41_10]|uniref:UDP-N-acetylmuramate--L-alanine ligase n=1 Tax=Candidatus Terrybacteria bacterium CG10_big_fil_rev_8_21_14_0_10_41_10 TaxID=1975026 RepID=A0A2M8LBK2_9BACT|nr:MAG: UDP-N-acetylmuramate--L-alanine ligase [Candidatus Terrybacteria bacterium CG10_big_fil_rev_8_21_14_0_10_41_10]
MMNIDLSKIKKTHFIGIGGIGMSAVAKMMLTEGKEVAGSDLAASPITQELEKMGVKISYHHDSANLPDDADLVIYSPAIKEDNPEFEKAKKLNITMLSYPQTLGLISEGKYTIAISGSHGKTTTTAMLGQILMDASLDPTIIVGSLMNGNHSNFMAGKGKYFVVEACEYKKSFLSITHPNIIVITNIDADHLDYYGTLENVKKAFGEFAAKLGENDYLVCDSENENLKDIVTNTKAKIINYAKTSEDGLRLVVPGNHNVKNAKAALAVAATLGIDKKSSLDSLNNFKGTWRRFEHKGKMNAGALVCDDYAHHPTEIKVTLATAKEFFASRRVNGGKIICIFQPHLYSRTKMLFKEFTESFIDADEVIFADIYAAREDCDGSINSEMLAGEIENAKYMESFEAIEKYIEENAREHDVIITMGAGDVYKIGENLLS